MSQVRPSDFASECPPERVIGSECEYNLQASSPVTPSNFVKAEYAGKLGLASLPTNELCDNILFLSNGSKIYPDLNNFIEYATPECLGPVQAAAADLAGAKIVSRLVETAPIEAKGVSRRVGFRFNLSKTAKTSGYHENYLVPNNILTKSWQRYIFASFLATRVWAGNGAVDNGYELTQKHRGIGQAWSMSPGNNRTIEGSKPMFLLTDPGTDDCVTHGWARCEVRYADANLSPEGRYLAFAVTSLILRLFEQQQRLGISLSDLELETPVLTAHLAATNPTLSRTFPLENGKSISAVDLQREFLLKAQDISDKTELPASEMTALTLMHGVLDKMELIRCGQADWSSLAGTLDVGAKFYMLKNSRHIDLAKLSGKTAKAVALDLYWEQLYGNALGTRYWQKQSVSNKSLVSPEQVDYLIKHPPKETRAFHRAKVIKSRLPIRTINWGETTYLQGRRFASQQWHNPYNVPYEYFESGE